MKKIIYDMSKYLKTPLLYDQKFSNIDFEKGIINDVHVCCEGEAKGHYMFLDKEFINNVVKFGNEQSAGLKSRFGHPNMSNTTLGTYIGRFQNFRSKLLTRDNGKLAHSAIADLHLDDVSKVSPNGDLYQYVLQLASTNPDMFGSSIQFRSGKSKYVKEKTGKKDKDGKDILKEKKYATIKSLMATDLVDAGAATDKLFSSEILAVNVTEYLDENPEIYKILCEKPEIVENFIKNYNNYRTKIINTKSKKNIMAENEGIVIKDEKTFFENIKNFFNPEIKDISEDSKKEFETQIEKLTSENSELVNKVSEFEEGKTKIDEENETFKNSIESNKKEIEKLTSENEKLIAENKKITEKKAAEKLGSSEPKNKEDKLGEKELSKEDKEWVKLANEVDEKL